MFTKNIKRTVAALFFSVCFLPGLLFRVAVAAEFGFDVEMWEVLDRRLQPTEPVFAELDGVQCLAFDNTGYRLSSRQPLAVGEALTVRFRLLPFPEAGRRERFAVNLVSGLNDVRKIVPPSLTANITYNAQRDSVGWSVTPRQSADIPADVIRRSIIRGGFNPDSITLDQSLGWPEPLRRQVESAVSPLSAVGRWLTLRLEIVAAHHTRLYLNGVLLADVADAGLPAVGHVSIECHNLRIATLKREKTTVGGGRHLPVDLSSALNESSIAGKVPVLTEQPRQLTVNGIPFVLPAVDAAGNNHVDIGRSWFPEGQMPGRASGAAGGTGGRWPEPLNSPAYRLQFKVPRGRYQALHLLAAIDGAEHKVPFLTAQFYRPRAGFPESFRSPAVPRYDIADGALPFKFNDGSQGNLHLITVPLEPGRLLGFDDLDALYFELTKGVQLFRAYPDPLFYSEHAAGLPSGVRVFAMTLEMPEVGLELKPLVYGDVWTEPELPEYAVTLTNTTDTAKDVVLRWELTSFDRQDQVTGEIQVRLPATAAETLQLAPRPRLYGYHDLALTMTVAGEARWTERRSLAFLHPDTRERGGWARGRGSLFGFWQWNGGHGTPPGYRQLEVMAKAGAETQHRVVRPEDEKIMEVARRYKVVDKRGFKDGEIYVANSFRIDLTKMPEAEALAKFMTEMRRRKVEPSDVHEPEYALFYPEPHLGRFSYGTLPEYLGEPPVTDMGPELEEKFQTYLNAFLVGGKALKEEWPGLKTYMPWGDPTFPIMFLRRSTEFREMLDGVGVDVPGFEHLPEKQIHQVALHRTFFLKQELRRTGKEDIDLVLVEGIHLPSRPGSLTEPELADLTIRSLLLYMGYGVDNFACSTSAFECSAAWGEQHYGGGLYNRIPLETPKPAYAAFATLTRNLNRCNFSRWLPTGSLSTYCLEFVHSQTGAKVYVLWTMRGQREVTLAVADPAAVTARDQMDNPLPLERETGKVKFMITPAPVFVHSPAAVTVENPGLPRHPDAKPAEISTKLGNLGDGSWRLETERDLDYEKSFTDWIRRTPAAMTVAAVPAPAASGGTALKVALDEAQPGREFMPYYTTLRPQEPVVISGKPAALGLWVQGASDWGRVVYSVRDAKGEKWLSVGQRGAWNCDDIHGYSAFNFDGWRYLSFPLPGHAAYDTYRENGTTWWGAYSAGDGIVDLPLTLEKIIVERRTHVMYVNTLEPAAELPVLLGDLYAEYASADDQTEAAVALSRLRMPLPETLPSLQNPLLELAAAAELPATEITGIRIDDQVADGTRCYVDFKTVAAAGTYDVWASCYPDGRGAVRLGRDWPESGRMIRGLAPDTDFYLFVVYADAAKKTAKPSAPFKIRLKDMFGMK